MKKKRHKNGLRIVKSVGISVTQLNGIDFAKMLMLIDDYDNIKYIPEAEFNIAYDETGNIINPMFYVYFGEVFLKIIYKESTNSFIAIDLKRIEVSMK